MQTPWFVMICKLPFLICSATIEFPGWRARRRAVLRKLQIPGLCRQRFPPGPLLPRQRQPTQSPLAGWLCQHQPALSRRSAGRPYGGRPSKAQGDHDRAQRLAASEQRQDPPQPPKRPVLRAVTCRHQRGFRIKVAQESRLQNVHDPRERSKGRGGLFSRGGLLHCSWK